MSLLVLVAAPTESPALDVGVTVALNAWGVGLLLLSRDVRHWVLVADTVLVAAVCLTQRWTVPPEALHGSTSWVLGIASIAVACWQWQSDARSGTVATAFVVVGYLVGSGSGSGAAAVVALWFGVEAALSRSLYRLLENGARAADRITDDVERAGRDSAVAAARRADARAHLAALHDTAAATLLAIGTGVVTGREPWLAKQFADDLETLTGSAGTPHGEVDLVRLLDDVVRRVPVEVTSSAICTVLIPAVPAVAICRSVREALVNVGRHAGVAAASVRVERETGRVVVEVADSGRGFDPERVPPHRRGISLSIAERMAGVGGRARVLSVPGRGTRVRLEWPDE
jgi:hypothetical protein